MLVSAFKSHVKILGRYIATQVQVIEKKIPLGNVSINYVQAGNGPKSLLLLPGAIGSAWVDFKPQIEKLPTVLPDHTIIAWDPPGYGKSRPPKRTFSANFYHDDADYAKQFMDALGRTTFSMAGWSDGGVSALILSAKYPSAVEKLIIWGSNSYISDEEIAIFQDIRDVSKWSKRMREPMEAVYGREGFAEIWSNWVDGCLAVYRERKGDICSNELANIKAPTLIVHGKKDPMLGTEHVPYLLKHIKGAEYFEFPDGKHNIHLKYADEFNKVVATFLNKN